MIFMRTKKVISIILCLIILFALSACSSKSDALNNNSDNSWVINNLICWDNVNYEVNTVLGSTEDINYVDFNESNGMTSVEFGWNSFSNDDGEGCKDILIMYYDDSLINVQSGTQPILGSVHYHYNDDMTTEWSYFGAKHNLIYKTVDYQIYDINKNLIGYFTQDGAYYDNENNPLDISLLDTFIDVLNNFENKDNYIENNSKQKVFSYLGNDYPVNVLPNFDVKYMEHDEYEEDNVCWVTFYSDDADVIDDIENYDFSNGSAELIYYIYDCNYNDIFSENAKILGAYSFSYTGKNSNGFDGWEIMYAPDGDIIFKTDTNRLLCGLHTIYYDNNDNIIAKCSGYDNEKDKSLFEKADGTIINEDEMRDDLEKLCPNEYLMDLI